MRERIITTTAATTPIKMTAKKVNTSTQTDTHTKSDHEVMNAKCFPFHVKTSYTHIQNVLLRALTVQASILATSNSLKWSTFIAFTFLFQFIIRERCVRSAWDGAFCGHKKFQPTCMSVSVYEHAFMYVLFYNVVGICDCMTFLPSLLLLRCVDLLTRLITHSHTCKNLLNLKRKFMFHIHFHSISLQRFHV